MGIVCFYSYCVLCSVRINRETLSFLGDPLLPTPSRSPQNTVISRYLRSPLPGAEVVSLAPIPTT